MTDERRTKLRRAVHCLHITNVPTDGVELIVELTNEALADSEALERVRGYFSRESSPEWSVYGEIAADIHRFLPKVAATDNEAPALAKKETP